ncbi:MAG: hypothetical protein JWR24_504 [Actinoallomurus sp.]|jgi:hypothetical protein|nr:hypothetical protein [Actinoallomurus sp.]
MPADDSLDQPPFSLLAMLAARYPDWTIWFGQATRHWWALPSHDRDVDDFIEAPTVKELVESIEATRVRRRTAPPSPSGILFGEAETSRAGRVPAATWRGGGFR